MDIIILWRALAAIGILGLVLLSILWNGWLTPIQQFPRSIEIAILVLPLLFFVRGILHGKRDTFVAASLLSLPYTMVGVWYILSIDEKSYGYLMLLLSLCLFLGGFLYARELDKREKMKGEK